MHWQTGRRRSVFRETLRRVVPLAAMLALDRRFLAGQQVDPAIVRAAALLSGPYDFYPFTEQRGRDALARQRRGDARDEARIAQVRHGQVDRDRTAQALAEP